MKKILCLQCNGDSTQNYFIKDMLKNFGLEEKAEFKFCNGFGLKRIEEIMEGEIPHYDVVIFEGYFNEDGLLLQESVQKILDSAKNAGKETPKLIALTGSPNWKANCRKIFPKAEATDLEGLTNILQNLK